MQITLTIQRQAPPGMLRKRMQHVVQEANSAVDGYGLRLAGLRGMAVGAAEERGRGVRGEFAAVEVNREDNFRLVGVARNRARADSCGHGCVGVVVEGWEFLGWRRYRR